MTYAQSVPALLSKNVGNTLTNYKTWGGILYNVKEYGAVGDGTTDNTAFIQAAINAMPVTGGQLYIPDGTYLLNADVSFGTKTVSVMMGPNVKFTGTGKMPQLATNSAHRILQNYQVYKPTGGLAEDGYSTLSVEVLPDSTFLGNAVAGFFGAKSPTSGNCAIWALNPIAILNAGFAGNAITVETDLDNYQADYKGQGSLITGVGNFKPEVGVKVTRANTTSDWKTGLKIEKSEIGIDINLSDATLAVYGLFIHGMPKDLIKLQPSTDTNPADAVIYVSNAADSQVNFKLTKRGGLVIGNNGTEIQKHISVYSGTLNFGSIPAQSTSELTVTVSGAALGDTVVANPSISMVSGVVWNAYVSATDTVTIRVANVTTGAVDPDGGGGANWRVDVWKH